MAYYCNRRDGTVKSFQFALKTCWDDGLTANYLIHMDFENPGLKDWVLRVVSRRCPGLSVKEMDQAADNLLQYMQVVWDIYKRLESEGRLGEVAAARMRMEQEQRLWLIGDLAFLFAWRAQQIELQTRQGFKPRNP